MKRGFFIVLLLSAAASVFSQNITQTIRGTVADKHSRTPLPGANVVLLDTEPPIGVATDVDGNFRLENIIVGRIGIKVSYMGYNPIMLNNLNLNSGKELILNIELEEKIISAKEFEVVAYKEKDKPINRMATVSARTFSVEETGRYAGSMNDVARMAANYAGVQNSEDSRNDIIIRGNSPTGVLYRFEGVDIPSPNHFTTFGTTGGPVSILNNNVLSNSDFMTGAFPAEYGNALSGVFDLKMRNGNDEQREFVGQFGFNGAELLAEGPFSKRSKSSYLISYRYSTLDLFKLMGIKFGTLAVPRYQDLSFKFNFKHKNASTALFGIGGISNINLLDSDIDTSNNIYGYAGEDIIFGSKVGAVGLSHTRFLNKKSYLKLTLSSNIATNQIDNDSLSSVDRSPVDVYNQNSYFGKHSAHFLFNKKFTAQHLVKAGFIFDLLYFNLSDSAYRPKHNRFVTLSDFNGSSQLFRPYFQWQYRITDEFIFNAGAHYQHFLYNNSSSIEPRIGIKWQFSHANALSFGYGLHSQLQPIQVYFEQELLPDSTYVTPNTDIGFTKSHHLVLAYDRKISENTRLKIETYYQSIFDAPVDINPSYFSMLNQGADFGIGFPDTLTNKGTGKNYGVELTVEQFLHKGLYCLITASLFESLYEGSDGIERNSAFNGNYIFNALAGKEFILGRRDSGKEQKTKKVLFFDIRTTLSGGQRYTPIDLNLSRLYGATVHDMSRIYEEKYEDYMRLDLKFGFRVNGKKTTQEWMVYLQNTTGRKNIFLQTYNADTGEIDTTNQIGFLPVVQYRIEF